jgi:hypothetical protein
MALIASDGHLSKADTLKLKVSGNFQLKTDTKHYASILILSLYLESNNVGKGL